MHTKLKLCMYLPEVQFHVLRRRKDDYHQNTVHRHHHRPPAYLYLPRILRRGNWLYVDLYWHLLQLLHSTIFEQQPHRHLEQADNDNDKNVIRM